MGIRSDVLVIDRYSSRRKNFLMNSPSDLTVAPGEDCTRLVNGMGSRKTETYPTH